MDKIKVALIGFGGIARAHNNAYIKLIKEGFPITLVAVCEKNTERIYENVQINLGGENEPLDKNVHIYSDVNELISKEDFDMADICLPTFLHKDFAIKFLETGKHVLCEKPMALSSGDCSEMIAAAKKNNKILMIGQCLRFDPCYIYLKQCIDSGEFGKLRYLTMKRFCKYPVWGADFGSIEKTGGCTLDTHIHDIDMARFLLGEPQSVSAAAYNCPPHIQVVNSRLCYGDTYVCADSSWDESREAEFEAGYRATFENANVICELDKVSVYKKGEKPYTPELTAGERISDEIHAIARAILNSCDTVKSNPPESAAASVRLIEVLRESAENGGKIINI